MERERTDRERRATEEFADVVRDQAARFFDSLVEEVHRNPEVLRPAPLTEEGADELALAAVHRAREEHAEDREIFAPPDADDADLWASNRDLKREARNRTWKPPRPR